MAAVGLSVCLFVQQGLIVSNKTLCNRPSQNNNHARLCRFQVKMIPSVQSLTPLGLFPNRFEKKKNVRLVIVGAPNAAWAAQDQGYIYGGLLVAESAAERHFAAQCRPCPQFNLI